MIFRLEKISTIIVTVCLFAVLTAACNRSATDNNQLTASKEERTIAVGLAPVKAMIFEERLSVQGTLEARDYAAVASRIDGTIEKIFVEEGDPVVKDVTKLFQIDQEKLTRAVEIKKQDLAVTRCALRERQAALEKVKAELHKAAIDRQRFRELFEEGAVSGDIFEQQQSRYDQLRASEKYAVSLVDLAREQVRQAEIALEIAQKDLSDSLVYAPISGVVSQVYQKAGEMGLAGNPVLRVEDTSVIELSAFLPARYYTRIIPGKSRLELILAGQPSKICTISYRSPTIDPRLRTFEIKSVISNPPKEAVPGALAETSIILTARRGLGVPAATVLERSGKSFVFVIANGKAHMIEVKTDLETDGYRELTGDALSEGTLVVNQGQAFLSEGTPVSIIEEKD